MSLLSRISRKKRSLSAESPSDYRSSERVVVKGYTAVFDGDETYEIRDLSAGGFMVLSANMPPPLKGVVEIRKNDRAIKRCPVMYAWSSNGYTGYQFKDKVPLSIPRSDYENAKNSESSAKSLQNRLRRI